MRRSALAVMIAVPVSLLVALPAMAATAASWTIQSIAQGYQVSYLLGVSCPSSSMCEAVGSDIDGDSSGSEIPFAELWSGGSWVDQTPVNPIEEASQLAGVSCSSTHGCTAVGFYYNSSNVKVPLAEAWSGSGWTLETAAIPSGASASQLTGVSCPKAVSLCAAVGYYINSSNVQVPLAEWWNGSSWSLQSISAPAGTTSTALSGVSCSSSSDCTAVGDYVNSSNVQLPLAERWTGSGSWTIQSVPAATGATSTTLDSVSCASNTACTSVGSYNHSGVVTLAEHWNGSAWTVQATPNPVPKSDRLFGVSCPSATACIATGSYVSPWGISITLAEHWSAGSWAVQTTPNPPSMEVGSPGQPFDTVSCSSKSACTAVGTYYSTAHFWPWLLAERYS